MIEKLEIKNWGAKSFIRKINEIIDKVNELNKCKHLHNYNSIDRVWNTKEEDDAWECLNKKDCYLCQHFNSDDNKCKECRKNNYNMFELIQKPKEGNQKIKVNKEIIEFIKLLKDDFKKQNYSEMENILERLLLIIDKKDK